MGWLEPTQDEVAVFHPAFEAVAREALEHAGLAGRLEWKHHPRTAGNSTIPDFVLQRRTDGRWLLAFELKRTREAVLSTRFQLQAKGYAETNQPSFARSAPCFFAISNLEVTLLFALNGGAPPIECRLLDGAFVSGEFGRTATAEHRATFARHLAAICERVAKGGPLEFDAIWPAVAGSLLDRAEDLPASERLALPGEPRTPGWDLVKGYFGAPRPAERVFLLRCLFAAFLRGFVDRELDGAALPPIRTDKPGGALRSLAQAIDGLRAIDFEALFEAPGAELYADDLPPELGAAVLDYLKELEAQQVAHHAHSRNDAVALPGVLFDRLYPAERDESGKVQTDPELARVLATFAIVDPALPVLDPCSGEGSLLAAAFDRLVALGAEPRDAMARLRGVEADPLSARLGALRIALKDVRALGPGHRPALVWGDTFAHADLIGAAGTVLMNPPFKRYEKHDARPVPEALRDHYADAIRALPGGGPTTTSGQANLFHYYVELAVRAARPGTRFGLILDNRWYHSQHGRPLREFLLEGCALEALVEYPHWPFFEQHRIATSIVVARRERAPRSARVRFVRCRADPRTADVGALARAYHEGAPWPLDWSERSVEQGELDPRTGWKARFTPDLVHDYRPALPKLAELFESSRRGSLNKEEGGVGVLEFPFGLESFGHRRDKVTGDRGGARRPYQTAKGEKLSRAADAELRALAAAIPDEFRGWAVKNSDEVEHFVLRESDVTRNPTLEPPALRAAPPLEDRSKRAPWSPTHDAAVDELAEHPATRAFLDGIARHANLTEEVLPRHELWVALREPPAGELIIPRKTRSGHRVHVNPFAAGARQPVTGRTVKLSSNFVSYSGCKCAPDGADSLEATKLIAAFLVSSFGQLQFEMLGYNREGLLSLECEGQLNEVRVLDPRSLSASARAQVHEAFARVSAPVATDRLSSSQPERNALDAVFAGELVRTLEPLAGVSPAELVREVHERLDEWLTARQP